MGLVDWSEKGHLHELQGFNHKIKKKKKRRKKIRCTVLKLFQYFHGRINKEQRKGMRR